MLPPRSTFMNGYGIAELGEPTVAALIMNVLYSDRIIQREQCSKLTISISHDPM